MERLLENWPSLKLSQRRSEFFGLSRPLAEELFSRVGVFDRVELLKDLPDSEIRSWLRFLPPDDAADFIQQFPKERQPILLELLDDQTKHAVIGLLAYAEDAAGGLMNPDYIRLRPDMTVTEAIQYIRAQPKTRVIYYAYALDPFKVLLGVLSIREILLQPADKLVKDIMHRDFTYVHEHMPSEEVALVFARNHRLMAVPVLDATGVMKGIVTHDDIASLVQRETTEDIQKIGGMEALEAPYFSVRFLDLIKKRAGWLTVLFLGEMLTATAMGYFEGEIAKAVVLALFVPLIISSGGNSGSQASTLIIRSLALHEVRLRDWWRVLFRELGAGLALGTILGSIGLIRIILWQQWSPMYGEHYLLVALTVAFSLIGVVLWGTISGSMLPFILRSIGFDPAAASAPFVATLVDVTGLIIYFTVGSIILSGTLL